MLVHPILVDHSFRLKGNIMTKSIIATLLATVNKSTSLEEALRDKSRFDLASDERTYISTLGSLRRDMPSVMHMSAMSYADVALEFEGGSVEVSARIIRSALYTAYTALFWAWVREQGITFEKDGKDYKTLFDMSTDDAPSEWDAPYAGSDTYEELSYEDALTYAEALLAWGVHLSRIKGFSWLLQYEHVFNFRTFCVMQIGRTSNAQMAEAYRQSGEAVKLHQMSKDEAYAVLRTWFDELVTDGTNESRRERIVTRVADRKFHGLIEGVKDLHMVGDRGLEAPGRIIKLLAQPELVQASPEFQREQKDWLASPEYALDQARKQQAQQMSQLETMQSTLMFQQAQLQMLEGQKQLEQMQKQMAEMAQAINAQMAALMPEVETVKPKVITPKAKVKAPKPKVSVPLKPSNMTAMAMAMNVAAAKH
jgi:hypothetical protein